MNDPLTVKHFILLYGFGLLTNPRSLDRKHFILSYGFGLLTNPRSLDRKPLLKTLRSLTENAPVFLHNHKLDR